MNQHPITIGEEPLTVDDMTAIAVDGAEVTVSPTALAQSAQGFREVEKRLAAGVPTYGVNTGFGHASTRTVSPESAMTLAQGLLRYHGCGTGDVFTEEAAAAIVAARLVSLARGYSAVRPAVLQSLGALLNHRLLPCVPVEGSVGASGDLTPLSYVAAALQGERHVFLNGRPTASADALTQTGLTALTLLPKESLAIMNGTSVMGGLLVLAWSRARRLSRLASATTAMACEVMAGVPDHFDPMVFQLKPHAGTVRAAGWIRLGLQGTGHTPARLQDRYCLRCAPHVIGVLEDTLQYTRSWIETEINGVNDNPIVDPESGAVFHGGNFYGGHLCAAADALKAAMASTAELLERQLIALCDEASNGDLPASLLPGDPSTAHGFKAMQISASALVAEALKLSVPASIFSRSTENHNQDKVSMGTIAARDALRIAELCERVLAIALIALAQGAELSDRCGGHAAKTLRRKTRDHVAFAEDDTPFDTAIASITSGLPDFEAAFEWPADGF